MSCGRLRAAALAVAALLVLAGCGGDGPDSAADGSPDPSSGSPASSVDLLARPGDIPDLIREEFGEAPSVRRINVFRDWLLVQLRDPDKPENLDDWTYRDGEWTSRPVSVSMSDIEALDDTTFQPSQIAWDAIPDLIDQALAGLDLEEETVDAVSYDRVAGDPPRVYIGVTGLRGNGRLLADADGTDVEVTRN